MCYIYKNMGMGAWRVSYVRYVVASYMHIGVIPHKVILHMWSLGEQT